MNRSPITVQVPTRLSDVATLLLLAFVCYQAHEWVRHLVGAALCGGFGTMTFTVAATRDACSLPMMVTLSGPMLTYGLAWCGMLLLLRSRHYALVAYGLVFASFAPLRFIQTLTGRGDELVIAEQLVSVPHRPLVAFLVFLTGLPPAVVAFQAIANMSRWRIFFWSWWLPLPLVFVLLFTDKLLFELTKVGIALGSVFGVWVPVLVTDLIAFALVIARTRYYVPAE